MNQHFNSFCQEFEADHFQHEVFWRAPASALRRTFLYPVFERFAKLFPDHVGSENTVFYLTEANNVTPLHQSIILTNSHFEHTHYDDIVNLLSFIEFASGTLNDAATISVDRLDAIREEIILVFHDPKKEVVELFKDLFPRSVGCQVE